MLTAKRLYLYGVMGAALVPLLWGLTDLLRLLGRAMAAAIGSREMVGAELVRNDLSFALALVLVALPIWLGHAWLIRRTTGPSRAAEIDERASWPRSTYFFLVLVITGGAAVLSLYEFVQQIAVVALTDDRAWGLAGAAAGSLVFGSAWFMHVWWRRSDLRVAAARTADDWLTRAYLYGGLFVLAVAATYWFALIGSIAVGELVGSRALWESWQTWQDAIVSPLAGAVGATIGWIVQWSLASRLLRAAPPMGEAHRSSRTRTGYFHAVVFVAAVAALILISSSLQQVLAQVLGVWRSSDGSRWIEDVGGPIIMAVPWLVAWWWHARQAAREASDFGGAERRTEVTRTGRLVVAFVGLGGLAIGVAWELNALLENVELGGRSLVAASAIRDEVAPALATAIVGLLMWAPTWARSQRDRASDPVAVATATSRRAYLLLVCAAAVVAAMASLAYLVYQVTRALLDAGPTEPVAWAMSVLLVAGTVLAYHLLQLRSDLALAPARTEEGAPDDEPTAAVETIEIIAPVGADFDDVNATIRTDLPEGFRMRVVGTSDAQH